MGKKQKLDCKVCGGTHKWHIPKDVSKGNPRELWLEEGGEYDANSSKGPCGHYLAIGGKWN
jgi:hypothetical protein